MDRREFVKAILKLREEDGIAFEVVYRRPYTIALIHYRDYEGWGAAKVCWPDQWNPERGQEIALAKAAQHIAEQVMPSES
ncbi:MAG: hypothetical protein ACYSR0_00460 [Planctomycetota bacterium]|jgi:hypothetical protein